MRKFDRVRQPDFLAENWEAWGLNWEERHIASPGRDFYWHIIDRTPVNQLLLKPLMQQTQEHCSFCDAHPVCPPSDPTIEHFRPKADYPRQAFQWENLYFCCRHCQTKEGSFSEDVLKPDESGYDFDRYFKWDHTTGILEVNPAGEPDDRERARKTIEYFRLNVGHPTYRKQFLYWRSLDQRSPLEPFAYRHFLEP